MTEPRAGSHGRKVLDRLLGDDPPPFALVHRPGATGGLVEILVGTAGRVASLADLPLPAPRSGTGAAHDLLTLVPYRQIAERGLACRDDSAELVYLTVRSQSVLPRDEACRRLPDEPVVLEREAFDMDDAGYAELVRRVVAEEIGRGTGANFVIKRSFTASIRDYRPRAAMSIFNRLLTGETGAYWTFLVHTGDRTFVGASPERHVSLEAGTVVMNPISGTCRYPATGPSMSDTLRFLADEKERDELFMVADEELKMMARMCPAGGRLRGPFLKEMARLSHTEYLLEGHSELDVRGILRETMFAPTVTGSPLESACQVLSRYEPHGRGHYAGAVALIGHDSWGRRTLDSAILIRTADIDRRGGMRIGVGATLVRHSDPASEVAETRAKAAGLLSAIRGDGRAGAVGSATGAGLAADERVRAALARRNDTLARFWLHDTHVRRGNTGATGQRILVIDAEDTFTAMLALQLAELGPSVTVRRFDEPYRIDDADMVVVGPGPGDPRDRASAKIAALRATTGRLLAERRPFLSVCLGHQVLADLLGLPLVRKARPSQGRQREIDFFGRTARVGFYNTFTAVWRGQLAHPASLDEDVAVCRDADSSEVHGLRGPWFRSVQFHPESILSTDGVDILGSLLAELLSGPLPRAHIA